MFLSLLILTLEQFSAITPVVIVKNTMGGRHILGKEQVFVFAYTSLCMSVMEGLWHQWSTM